MQQPIEVAGPVMERLGATQDGTILLAGEAVSETGGWMHVPLKLATPGRAVAVVECSVRVRISVDREARRCLYLEQIEIAGRRFAGLGSVGAAFGKSLAQAVPRAVEAYLLFCIQARRETQPEVASSGDTIARAPGADAQPARHVTRVWGA